MDANKAIITNIFNNSTMIEVPFFQRTYVWKEDLWERLQEDMEFVTLANKPHFLGSIILKEGDAPLPTDNFTQRKTIVDGQQRLTTFLIFMKVLCLKSGQTALFDVQFRIMGQEIALRHGRNDIDAFETVMAMNSATKITDKKSRIIDCFNYYVESLDERKLKINSVMMNAQFVRIDLNADEDEQQIFDTINSLGVNLTTSELLKNYFFNRNSYSDYVSKWESEFEKDISVKEYWDQPIEVGRTKRAMIDIFFDSFFQIFIQDKKYTISTEDRLVYNRVDQLAQSYQDFISKYCGGDKNIVIDKVKEYAQCFRNIFRPEYCDMSTPATAGVERMNVIIFGMKATTLMPYLLYMNMNIQDEGEIQRMYAILESYIMRRMVARETTKGYNKLFVNLIANEVLTASALETALVKNTDGNLIFPDDTVLEQSFQQSKMYNLQARGIMYMIESYVRSSRTATAMLGFRNYSLEHLMPKKWRNNWNDNCSDVEARQRDNKLLTLGNLAIIPLSLNTAIRDGDWKTKLNGKGKNKPGLKECAAGLYTVADAISKDTWTVKDIEKRGAWLYSNAKELWQYPQNS